MYLFVFVLILTDNQAIYIVSMSTQSVAKTYKNIFYAGKTLSNSKMGIVKFGIDVSAMSNNCAHSGLKSSFFIWGFKTNLQEKNMEWQRENLATLGIMKSFDPIK
jgi:hypothetical protein